jgi:hypothetical protein
MQLTRKPGKQPIARSSRLERAQEYVASTASVYDSSFADLALHTELGYYVPRKFVDVPLEELVSNEKYANVVQLAYQCGWVRPTQL